ncbi:MAG TPA: hypothetical protein VN934_03525 [Candidatus Tumulicola sp.]|nr:hypothetical protein [Candidatus Tumulicola sp.]
MADYDALQALAFNAISKTMKTTEDDEEAADYAAGLAYRILYKEGDNELLGGCDGSTQFAVGFDTAMRICAGLTDDPLAIPRTEVKFAFDDARVLLDEWRDDLRYANVARRRKIA